MKELCANFAKVMVEQLSNRLTDAGFSHMRTLDCAVVFESQKAFLKVKLTRLSYEIEILYTRKCQQSRSFSLGELINASFGVKEPTLQASTPERVLVCATLINDMLEQHGARLLRKIEDDNSFTELASTVQRAASARTQVALVRNIREDAEDAWRKGDFPTVERLYKIIEIELSAAERKRLRIAQRRANKGTP